MRVYRYPEANNSSHSVHPDQVDIWLQMRTFGPYAYAFPTMLAQISILVALLGPKSNLKSPFYRVVCYTFALEFLGLFLRPVTSRLNANPLTMPLIELLLTQGWLLTGIVLINLYTTFAQHLCFCLLILNRTCFLVSPTKGISFWERYLWPILGLTAFTPLVFTWQLAYCGVVVHVMPGVLYHIDYDNDCGFYSPNDLLTPLQVGLAAFDTLLVLICIGALSTKRALYRADDGESQLCVYAVVLGWAQLVFGGLVVFIAFPLHFNRQIAVLVYVIATYVHPMTFDVLAVISVWGMLFGSQKLRSEIKRIFLSAVGAKTSKVSPLHNVTSYMLT